MAINVAIIGATAYSSQELIRILLGHPEARITHLGGRREGAPQITEIFPEFAGLLDLPLGSLTPDGAASGVDVAFFTLSPGVSMAYVPGWLGAGVKCVDFSADYRFADAGVYESWYAKEHTSRELCGGAAYGIPELWRGKLAGAELVANPGCYPTATLLGLAPLAKAGLVPAGAPVFVDAKSGVSGRGNKVQEGSLYCDCNESLQAYGVRAHRHQPEIVQGMERLGAGGATACFVPHLVPMDRGILVTIYVQATDTDTDLQELYEDFYGDEPFVRVKPAGVQPRTKDVSFTNFCDVSVTRTAYGPVVVTSAIDNLWKGAASQAVQNMNAMLRLDERLGLWPGMR
jgi:N-acetyl-gamma-glutamyl-phosphate reductase